MADPKTVILPKLPEPSTVLLIDRHGKALLVKADSRKTMGFVEPLPPPNRSLLSRTDDTP